MHNELGCFGNIWVRQNYLHKKGDSNDNGHMHKFDHVSLLTSGSVRIEVEGHEPKEFKAPTFIIVRKEHKHRFVALEDGTIWYCVFALRDLDGQPIDELYDENLHDPLSAKSVPDDYWEKAKLLDEKTSF